MKERERKGEGEEAANDSNTSNSSLPFVALILFHFIFCLLATLKSTHAHSFPGEQTSWLSDWKDEESVRERERVSKGVRKKVSE